jgi:hypothetical protein
VSSGRCSFEVKAMDTAIRAALQDVNVKKENDVEQDARVQNKRWEQ